TDAPSHGPAANTAVLPEPFGYSRPAAPSWVSKAIAPKFVTTIETWLTSMRCEASMDRFPKTGGRRWTPGTEDGRAAAEVTSAVVSAMRRTIEVARGIRLLQSPVDKPPAGRSRGAGAAAFGVHRRDRRSVVPCPEGVNH